jgi:microcystin-dependent protein
MAQPYIGEIRMFAGNFAPAGWMFCDGQLLPISENDALFILIGTMYGGDGTSTFALPDLRGRVPIHVGNGNLQAETGGVESVTLTVQQIPTHSHPLIASTNVADQNSASGNVVAQGSVASLYFAAPGSSPLGANSITPTGGSQPHSNMQPYLCLSFIISLFGIFPSQT